jgi:hypothetical protein
MTVTREKISKAFKEFHNSELNAECMKDYKTLIWLSQDTLTTIRTVLQSALDGMDLTHSENVLKKTENFDMSIRPPITYIEEIELPAGEYKINGEMQSVEHSFIVKTAPQQDKTPDTAALDALEEIQAELLSYADQEYPNRDYPSENRKHKATVLNHMKLAKTIRAALTRPVGWMPIESAPRDGSEFICLFMYPENYNYSVCVASFKDGYIHMEYYCDNCPTHWMPLPAAPKEGE